MWTTLLEVSVDIWTVQRLIPELKVKGPTRELEPLPLFNTHTTLCFATSTPFPAPAPHPSPRRPVRLRTSWREGRWNFGLLRTTTREKTKRLPRSGRNRRSYAPRGLVHNGVRVGKITRTSNRGRSGVLDPRLAPIHPLSVFQDERVGRIFLNSLFSFHVLSHIFF